MVFDDLKKRTQTSDIDWSLLRNKVQANELRSPTFIIPKKDGRIQWIRDLRALDKVVVRKQYPLLTVNDILRKRNGYS